jgi:hypothetical protein
LLCNNIPIATHTRNSTVPSLLWYSLVNSEQFQKTTFGQKVISGHKSQNGLDTLT